MRISIVLQKRLMERAAVFVGIRDPSTLVRLGLQALIEKERRKRLATLGGTQRELRRIPRRKSAT